MPETIPSTDDCSLRKIFTDSALRYMKFPLDVMDKLQAPYPIAEAKPFFKELAGKCLEKYDKFISMNEEDKKTFLEKRYHEAKEKDKKIVDEANAKMLELDNYFAALFSYVEKWNPPTPEHKLFKEHMLQSLKETRSFATNPRREYQDFNEEEWLDSSAYEKSLRSDISRFQGLYDKEVNEAESKNKWIKEFIDSLNDNNMEIKQ